jgi:hypothetical protein
MLAGIIGRHEQGTAHLDARRRQLRGMLADALLGY